MISVNYTEGKDLSNSLNNHMNDYDINILEHRKVSKIEDGKSKFVLLNSGEKIKSKAIIIATGAEWKMLGIEYRWNVVSMMIDKNIYNQKSII